MGRLRATSRTFSRTTTTGGDGRDPRVDRRKTVDVGSDVILGMIRQPPPPEIRNYPAKVSFYPSPPLRGRMATVQTSEFYKIKKNMNAIR